jgi:hypothetical protein
MPKVESQEVAPDKGVVLAALRGISNRFIGDPESTLLARNVLDGSQAGIFDQEMRDALAETLKNIQETRSKRIAIMVLTKVLQSLSDAELE